MVKLGGYSDPQRGRAFLADVPPGGTWAGRRSLLRDLYRQVTRRRPRPGLLQGEDGVTLAEMLVALAILGMVGVAFLVALGTSFRTQDLNREQVRAENLARAQLEYIRFIPYDASNYDDDVPPPGVTLPQGYTIAITTASYCDGVGEAGFEPCYDPANIQKNTIRVFRDGRAVTTVEDLKSRR